MHKFILTALILFLLNRCVLPNAAQPGIWNAGGMGNFSLLFPDDSLAYKKIQMSRERVSIQLYKGYAVVKGEYYMFNDTKDTIKLRTGYPLNTNFNSETRDANRAEILFDSLFGLKVLINSVPVKLISEPSEDNTTQYRNDNWYVWNNTFPPLDTTVITVYFIVNTNDNIIRKGYARDENNGFIYLLETGSTWKQPIISGEIRIKLEDNISIDELNGLKPDSVFKTDEKNKVLQYIFLNLSPNYRDNIILTYGKKNNELNFDKILSEKDILYNKADKFSAVEINSRELSSKKYKSPFEVESTDWGSLLFILSIIGIPVLIIIFISAIIIIIVVMLYKKSKKEKTR